MIFFARQILRDFQHTGAIAPSGPRLAGAMTRRLRAAPGRRRVLEVGPGTGPFTKAILKALRPGDAFDLVEINDEFCDSLERRLLSPFRTMHPDIPVTLHRSPVEAAPLTSGYDFIICGLPFNNFPPPAARGILRNLLALLRPGGELTYFEYAGVRAMKAPLVGSRGRRRLKRIGAMNKSLSRRHDGERDLVIGNFPPAVAISLTRAHVDADTITSEV